MKELSIEEKAKRYDEAKARMSRAWNDNRCSLGFMNEIFPELAESEDEGVWLKKFIQEEIDCLSIDIRDCDDRIKLKNLRRSLAWLEKQGEEPNNVYDKELSEILCRVIRRYINDPNIQYTEREKVSREIIPYVERLEKQSTTQVRTGLEWVDTIDDACDKRYSEEYAHGEYCHEQSFKWGFQEGVDWLEKQAEQKPVISNNALREGIAHFGITQYQIDNWLKKYVDVEKQGKKGTNGNEREIPFLAWSEEDERIRKEIINFFEHYPNIIVKKERRNDWIAWLENQAQKPVFEMITPEESLGIDSDTYNKIVDECIYGEQKPVCSEEQHEKESLSDIENRIINFAMQFHDNRMKPEAEWEDELKMLRDNIKIDPWSEEDEKMLNDVIMCGEHHCYLDARNIAWLKYIKDRYTWKPSDEQVKALNYVINLMASSESPKENDYYYNVFKGLREQLMKLRGE